MLPLLANAVLPDIEAAVMNKITLSQRIEVLKIPLKTAIMPQTGVRNSYYGLARSYVSGNTVEAQMYSQMP